MADMPGSGRPRLVCIFSFTATLCCSRLRPVCINSLIIREAYDTYYTFQRLSKAKGRKIKMKGFWYFFKYALIKQPSYIVFSVFSTLLNSLSPVLLIYVPKLVLDAALAGFKRDAVLFVLLYVLSYLGVHIASSWIGYGANVSGGKLFAEFQMDMGEKLIDADLDKLESNAFKEQSERAKKYIYADGWGFGYIFSCFLQIIEYAITAAAYIYIIYKFSIILVFINLFFTFISFRVGGKIKEKEKLDQDQKIKHERKTKYYTDIVSDHRYMKDIRIFSYKSTLMRKMRKHYETNTKFYARINRRHVFSEMLTSIFYIIQICLGYCVIIPMLAGKTISVGDFTLYISALTSYAGIMGKILDKIVYVHSYDMYFNDFKEYMSIPPMRSGRNRAVDNSGKVTIEFRNVSFRYGSSSEYALKNVNVKLDNTDRIAIVGENGSGKSTFIKLLLRLYDPVEGTILVNGVDIREYSYDEYINQFSVAFQDYSLFAATIEENITMDDQKKLDGKFIDELSDIGLLNKVIRQYPKHFDTNVYRIFDDSGIEPSGGEGQQIAIARSLYRDSRIKVLDEPTAALDPKMEHELYQKYDRITKGNLSLFVSHRLGSCKFANRILVFDKGNIVEDGSHTELMEKEGHYAKLFHYQANLYSMPGK